MEFEWDDIKHTRTLRNRGIGFDDGALIFTGRLVVWIDTRRDYGEIRFRAIGKSAENLLHVAFTYRGNAIRIISVRRANCKEINQWQSNA